MDEDDIMRHEGSIRLEALSTEFHDIYFPHRAWGPARASLEGRIRTLVQHLNASDITWMKTALEDDSKKWFVAFVFRLCPPVPDDLFDPLARAGANEPDPSFSSEFIVPLCQTDRARLVALLKTWADTGDTETRHRVANAQYWANEQE